jgi:hypothetical protein
MYGTIVLYVIFIDVYIYIYIYIYTFTGQFGRRICIIHF